MRGKILIVTGMAVGYVLGARAGRERYEQIKRAAIRFWNNPRVQVQVDRVEDFAKDKAPDVVDFLSDSAKKVVSQVRSSQKKSTASTASRSADAAQKASASTRSTSSRSGGAAKKTGDTSK